MISGRDALGTVQSAVKQEQARLADVERQIAATTQRFARLDVERGEAIQALARVRLGHLASGGGAEGVTEGVAEADARVLAMLERRDAQLAELHDALAALEERVGERERERDAAADALERANRALDDGEAATQARLEADEAYRAARDRADAARRVASHAADKAERSAREREQKERAYHDDPLFMYLWRRGFGTAAYRALPLTRYLDGRVARLVGFDAARVNYARLQELPVRLAAHAQAAGDGAEAAYAALAELDLAARRADGVVELEAARDRAADELAQVDARLEALGSEHEALHARLEAMAQGDDPTYQAAVAYLAGELGRDDLQTLRRQALATPYPEDDAIVARLTGLEAERVGIEATVAELKTVLGKARERVREAERLRIEFTRRRFDQPGSSFEDGALLATVLSQFLHGALTLDGILRVLHQQQRQAPQRSDPTFGSGGFGRGSPWSAGGGAPRPSAPPRPPAPPRTGGGLGGGGFRTGGRVGGGFKTGGKF